MDAYSYFILSMFIVTILIMFAPLIERIAIYHGKKRHLKKHKKQELNKGKVW